MGLSKRKISRLSLLYYLIGATEPSVMGKQQIATHSITFGTHLPEPVEHFLFLFVASELTSPEDRRSHKLNRTLRTGSE